MTETRLRTWTHSVGYSLATVFIFALALQNLRYGFYPLFYLAAGLAALTAAGLIYTIVSRKYQLAAAGHLLILTGLNGALLAAMFVTSTAGISHWIMPLLLLNLLILPLRYGLMLSLLLLAPTAALLFLRLPTADALTITTGAFILLAVAVLYVWHYDHMAQSAEDLAIIDPGTGAHNGRFLDEALHKEISRAITIGHRFSVIHLAIDHASEATDLHGTASMQALRRDITRHLFGVIRAGDTVYTLDNSEFFLILPFTAEEGVRVIAERIRRTISESHWPVTGKVTVSLGCTTRVNSDTLADSLRTRAGTAMHKARKRGGDCVWFSPVKSSQP